MTPATIGLTAGEIDHFRGQGYVVREGRVFDTPTFDRLVATFDDVLADATSQGIAPEAIDVPHFVEPRLLDFALHDDVLAIVRPLLGDDIGLFSTHFICKPGGVGRRVPWHEDSAYWRGKIEPMEVCTMWIAIDPSTHDNGCMMVIPRSHVTGTRGYSDYEPVDATVNVFDSEVVPAQRDESRAALVELDPNQCSLHDARTMHGSRANTSTMRRCGWTLRFFPLTSRFDHDQFGDVHHVYLACGQDRAGNHFADPSRAYPELAAYRRQRIKNSH
jgi:ectoine hydroxylase-related dioxygenase (phytanoyl-CoA dioxygenase family)